MFLGKCAYLHLFISVRCALVLFSPAGNYIPRPCTGSCGLCLPVVLRLEEVELFFDAVDRLRDRQLERSRLRVLKRQAETLVTLSGIMRNNH